MLKSLEDDWRMWVEHFISYSVAVAIGAFFIASLPLIGCVVCCCRKRGKCGGNIEPIEPKHAKCKRITCSTLLLTFSAVVLLAVTSCFLCTRLVRDQTVPSGTMRDIQTSLETVESYVDATQEEIWTLNSQTFDPHLQKIRRSVLRFSTDAQESVGTSTGVQPLFRDLQNHVNSIPELLENLNALENSTRNLETQAAGLSSSLRTITTDFATDFAGCNSQQCEEAKTLMSDLRVEADFTGQDLDSIQADIESVLSGPNNISATMRRGWEEYAKIHVVLSQASGAPMESLLTELENYAQTFDVYTNETITKLQDFDMSETRRDISDSVAKELDDVGYYVYIGWNAVSSLALLMVTVMFVAILFGCCGDRPGDYVGFCNRGNGSRTLLCALVTFFLTSWILMICTTVMLLGGGLSYTELCRHLQFEESPRDMVVIDNMVTSYFKMSGASARTIMENCEQDQAFYRAFEIGQHYPQLNVSQVLDPSDLNLDATLENLLSQDYSIDPVEMLNSGTKAHLVKVETALGRINIQLYKSMATQNITTHDLSQASELFTQFASETASSDPDTAARFRDYSQRLAALHNGIVQIITSGMNDVGRTVTAVETFDASLEEEAQAAVTSDELSIAAGATMTKISNDITALVQRIEGAVETSVGRCHSVYGAMRSSISSVCVSFLYPFNAFWFSLGCAIFFLTLSVPVALTLVSLYRRSVPYLSPDDLIGQPQVHRRSRPGSGSANHNGVLRLTPSSASSASGNSRNSRQVPGPPRYTNPYHQGSWNDAFMGEGDGYIDYQILRDHPQRGQPIRPTSQNYVVELRPMGPNMGPMAHRPVPNAPMGPMPNGHNGHWSPPPSPLGPPGYPGLMRPTAQAPPRPPPHRPPPAPPYTGFDEAYF